jgi:acetyltransferase-like isoleucine patch superfamily enzyme
VIRRIFNRYLTKKQRLHELQQLGKTSIVAPTARFSHRQNISIGEYCRIGIHCYLEGKGGIQIGDGTIFAPEVVVLSSSHDYDFSLIPYGPQDKKECVKIGRGVWVGYGAKIGRGVEIGDAAIVAMGAVVTKNVESGSIVGGNPAKEIGRRENMTEVNRLIEQQQFFLKAVGEGLRREP